MRRVAVLPLFLLLSGCFKTSPPLVFHALAPLVQEEKPPASPAPFALEMMPVLLPELLQRSQIVTRNGSNTLAILETHRWGNTLGKDMQRVVAENLCTLLGGPVVNYPFGERVKAKFRVTLDVHRCDGQPGGNLQFHCTWMVTRWEDGQAVLVRDAIFQEAVVGRDPEILVAAHSRVLAALSREVAVGIRSLKVD